MIIGEALKRAAINYRDKIAVKDDYGKYFPAGFSYTYGQLMETVNRLGNSLLSLGLKRGDRVAVQTGTGIGHVVSLLSLANVGMAIAPIDRTFMGEEIVYQINDAGAAAFICDADIYKEKILPIRSRLPSVKAFIGIGEHAECEYNFSTLIEEGSPEPPGVSVSEDDIATLIYTSGTTGRPKGAPLTHRNWSYSAVIWAAEQDIHPYTRWLIVMPMHTSGGTGMTITSAIRGCSLFLSNPDPKKMLDIITREKITFTQFSPTLLAIMLQHPDVDKTDFSHIEHWFTSAAPISAELLTRGSKYLGPKFIQVFGTTETALLGTVLRPQEVSLEGPMAMRLTSIGRACLGYQVKVVDENGKEVGLGQTGEIAIRGEAVAKGYWNKPDADDFKDGWWHSGDMVRIDDDGFFYIVDRKKDMIVSGGNNVYPREVEDVISKFPGVHMVSVIGVPSEKWGEEVKAVIVPVKGAVIKEEEIIAFCKERMASYKKPKTVDFIDISQMPMTGGNYKILKRVLRDRYREENLK